MKFEFSEIDVHVLHVLSNKPSETTDLYTQVKLGIDVAPKEAVAGLLGYASVEELMRTYFVENRKKAKKEGEADTTVYALRGDAVTQIDPEREYLGEHMVFFQGLKERRALKIKSFEVYVLGGVGEFGMQMSIQVNPENPAYLFALHESMHTRIKLAIEHDRPDLVDAAARAEKKPGKVKRTDADQLQQAASAMQTAH